MVEIAFHPQILAVRTRKGKPCLRFGGEGGSFFTMSIFEPLQARSRPPSLAMAGIPPVADGSRHMDDPADRAERAKRGSPYLNPSQTAFFLGISAYHLLRLRRSGKGPKFRRHSHKVQYHIDDIQAWSDAQAEDHKS